MPEFLFIIRNEKKTFYHRFAILLLLLNDIAVIYVLSSSTLHSYSRVAGIVLFITGNLTAIFYLFRKKTVNNKYIMHVVAITLIGYWIYTSYPWAAILLLILYMFYSVSLRPLVVTVNESQVVYPSFPKKHFSWKQISNIIYRDGLLTIDLVSNRIIQQLVDETKTFVDEKTFNQFSAEHLKQKSVKQV